MESAARYNENTKEQSSKIKDGIRCADEFMKYRSAL
jgi:hypothetical protein